MSKVKEKKIKVSGYNKLFFAFILGHSKMHLPNIIDSILLL